VSDEGMPPSVPLSPLLLLGEEHAIAAMAIAVARTCCEEIIETTAS
jgi:hypothetical protein